MQEIKKPVVQGARCPASLQQSRIWFAEHIGSHGSEFNFPYAVRVAGPLDERALRRALDTLVVQHSVLRTSIVDDGDELTQVICAPYEVLGATESLNAAQDFRHVTADIVSERFDLAGGKMLRARLYRLGQNDHLLILVVHHIATDGWSMELLFNDLQTLYAEYRAGRDPERRPVPCQYVEYSEWQQRGSGGDASAPSLAYWRDQLVDAPLVLDLPLDRPRPRLQSFKGDWVSFGIPVETIEAVARFAHSEDASEYMVLLAAYELLIARWSDRDDLIVGVPVANRARPEFEEAVGFFINLLPLRAHVDERRTFREHVRSVRDRALDALEHQDLSLDRLVEDIAPQRTLAHNPVIQTTFAHEPLFTLTLDGLACTMVDVRPPISRYDIAIDYWDEPDGGRGFDAYFSTDIFDRCTVEELTSRFVWLVGALVADPDTVLAATPAASPTELAGILTWGGHQRAHESPTEWFHEAVARKAEEEPGALAVGGAEPLTFSELESRATQVAGLLARHGAGADSPVGVRMERSSDLVVALLGTLKAGAAFVPLDPSYPKTRTEYVLRDASIRIVVTSEDDRRGESAWSEDVCVLTLNDARPDDLCTPVRVDPRSLAYIIYTSGSTGAPKGVEVTHEGLANLVCGLKSIGITGHGEGRVGWNASPSFDASVQQWCRLAHGDAIFPLDEFVRQDPEELLEYARREKLTDLDITPSHLELIVDGLSRRTREDGCLRVLVGGEPMPPALWAKMRDLDATGATKSFNLYGITEATVDTCAAPLNTAAPHLGRPLSGSTVTVVDRWRRPVPPGVSGELLIGGRGLARGYLGRASHTAARYVPDPFASDGSRTLRTHDRARWTREGHLEFLGRMDRQVKVRGFRVELGEVEHQLTRIDGVRSAVALLRDVAGSGALIAYYTRAETSTVAPAEIRTHLFDVLPAFMIPTEVVLVDGFELGPNGKIDASRLPAPGLEGDAAPTARPVGAIETLIASVWAEVLAVDKVSADDDFFALGGHSLMAIRVIGRLKRRMKLKVPMTAVFEHPKLRSLARYVENEIRAQLAESDGR